MLNQRPFNGTQVAETTRFHSHYKGMGDVETLLPDSPVLQFISDGKYIGNTEGIYQGVTRSRQRALAGLGDDGTDASGEDLTALYGPDQSVLGSPGGSFNVPTATQQSLITGLGLPQGLVTNPSTPWLIAGGALVVFLLMNQNKRR